MKDQIRRRKEKQHPDMISKAATIIQQSDSISHSYRKKLPLWPQGKNLQFRWWQRPSCQRLDSKVKINYILLIIFVGGDQQIKEVTSFMFLPKPSLPVTWATARNCFTEPSCLGL